MFNVKLGFVQMMCGGIGSLYLVYLPWLTVIGPGGAASPAKRTGCKGRHSGVYRLGTPRCNVPGQSVGK